MHSFQVPNREEDACFWRNSSPPNLAAARDCPGLYRAEALLSSALHHSAKSKRSSSLLFSTACPCGGLFVWPGITCHLYHRWNQEPLKCLFFRAAEPPFLVGVGGGGDRFFPQRACVPDKLSSDLFSWCFKELLQTKPTSLSRLLRSGIILTRCSSRLHLCVFP